MQLSIATATLYLQPFEQVLEMIAEAGFQNIELDLFWERKEWAMAQHLKDVPVKQAVQQAAHAGLHISSIHDGGGVLENEHSALGFINPVLDQYLDEMGYAPDCLVFHTPHIEGSPGDGWWERASGEIARALEKYRGACAFVTIENMPLFDGYCVPLTTPEALGVFAVENGLNITFDTTHYAQIGIDIVAAARKLAHSVKTVHLSDFAAGRAHAFIGEGDLALPGFFEALDKTGLNAVTLECTLSSPQRAEREMSRGELVGRMREARVRAEELL